jgi:hypothetical protein
VRPKEPFAIQEAPSSGAQETSYPHLPQLTPQMRRPVPTLVALLVQFQPTGAPSLACRNM